MKNYYAEVIIVYVDNTESNEESFKKSEIYKFIFNETTLKKAKEEAKRRAILQFNDEFGLSIKSLTLEDCYETTSDAML